MAVTFAGSTPPIGIRPLPPRPPPRPGAPPSRIRPPAVRPPRRGEPMGPWVPPTDNNALWWQQFIISPEQQYLRRGLYSTYAGGLGGPSNYQGWLNTLYPQLESRFYGAIMPQIQAGQMPNVTFEDWLKTLNLGQEFLGLNPYARGERPGAYAAPGRFVWR